jgi:hypothetical protein
LIKRKTSERDRLQQEIEQCNAAMAPLAAKQAAMQAMDDEIHVLFRRALERAKPRKREHQQLRQLYEQLQEDGVISPDPERAAQSTQRCDCPVCVRADATDPWPSDPFTREPASAPDSAQRHPASPRPARDSGVRALYHKLALHFHPDRAQGEQRAAHEAVMREVNDAYHGGDTERLIALSRELGIDVGELESSDGLLAELVRQYEQIKAEVRDLRDSMLGFLVTDMRRA